MLFPSFSRMNENSRTPPGFLGLQKGAETYNTWGVSRHKEKSAEKITSIKSNKVQINSHLHKKDSGH